MNLALLTLVLIATQSAFYGPVKYGVIAELVDRRRLGPANGWIAMSTQIAIVGACWVRCSPSGTRPTGIATG